MTEEREIENLIYRYAELIDAGDLAAVADLFRNASIVAPDGGETRGYDAVLAMYEGATRIYPESGTPCTQHVTTNLQLTVDSEAGTARGSCYFTVFQSLPDFPLQAIIAGQYRDSFERSDEGWRFSRREMYPRLFGDLSRHLLFDPEQIR
jgi:3-phenylpropionate/cinnamic acid dioxygenase small subunit